MRINLSKENTHGLGAMRNGPHRHIAAITSGFIKGEGVEAEILPGGADWVMVCFFFRNYTPFQSLPFTHSRKHFILMPSTTKARPLNRRLTHRRPHAGSRG